ncbi:MAG: tetratricopeptide repeat protein, partial [Rhodospirillales bacterium]|nr:tetratricopeptide repeat protein [Rhodospirillales bacterium]
DWAMTQNNLGTALATLGERESGTARLEDAVIAYRNALEERTRERVPLDWALTQMNLGKAFQALGERTSNAALLRQARDYFAAAFEVYVGEAGMEHYREGFETRIAALDTTVAGMS